MTLQEKINIDIIEAMKEKNADKLAALRSVKSAIMLEATKEGISQVSDVISLKLIAKLVKQRKDSAIIYENQDRHDLAVDEINQMKFLELYLPAQMNDDEIKTVVKEVIRKSGANSIKDMGKCMGILISKLDGVADSSTISKLVKQELS
jgi:uncharacterized protein YqeY